MKVHGIKGNPGVEYWRNPNTGELLKTCGAKTQAQQIFCADSVLISKEVFERWKEPASLTCQTCQKKIDYMTAPLYPLFEHMSDEHGLTLTESEMGEIMAVCADIAKGE